MGCCFSHYGLPEVTPFPAHVEHPVVKPKPTYRRPPVKLTEIDESGSGDDHAALVSYSINGRNGYKATEIYELMDHNVVGRGGFGVIHRVTHKFQQGSGPLPQYYALKRTRPFELDRHVSLQDYDDITYKVGEVRSLLALRGAPNTLQIREFFYDFEASRNAASLALVTELMTGQNLNEWIHENRSTMTEKTVSLITRSLLNAVRYFHGKNIVHRDIKVSNLRITNPMDPRSIKVYDFGLATVLDAQTPEISDGFAPGTPGYMAPEISLGQSYGIEVDMFSTGAVIFFLLSGYRPFVHQNRATVRRRTINCEYSMDQESWNRVSSEAQMLVRGLLVHREYPRLSAEDAICHPWLTGDEITLAHQESRDLSPNAMGVEVGVTSTETRNTQLVLQIPHARVEADVRDVLSLIRETGIGKAKYAFAADGTACAVPLIDYVKRHPKPYTEDRCRLLFSRVFMAVEALHDLHVVHRTIKQEHVFVKHSGDTVEIVIGGLQLARIVENGDVLTGSCGTGIAATAPEVYRAIYYGKAVDLWALGILLYEFMTGGLHPFRGYGRDLREAVANADVVFDDFYPGSPESRDLICGLICADPRRRLTASQALGHRWFQTDTLVRNDLSLVQELLNDL